MCYLKLTNSRRVTDAGGFTLLEALVALVVFSSVGLVMYDVINGNLASLSRVREAAQKTVVVRQLLEELGGMNPQGGGEGERQVGDLRLAWRVETLRNPVPGRAVDGGNRVPRYRTI